LQAACPCQNHSPCMHAYICMGIVVIDVATPIHIHPQPSHIQLEAASISWFVTVLNYSAWSRCGLGVYSKKNGGRYLLICRGN
jgi:hypothetical protein